MKKQVYKTPELRVINIRSQYNLLLTSGQTSGDTQIGIHNTGASGTEENLTKENSFFWDEE